MVKFIRLCLVRDMFKMHSSTVKQVFAKIDEYIRHAINMNYIFLFPKRMLTVTCAKNFKEMSSLNWG